MVFNWQLHLVAQLYEEGQHTENCYVQILGYTYHWKSKSEHWM